MKVTIKSLLIVGIFLVGCFLGWFFPRTSKTPAVDFAPVDVRFDSTEYSFINPLIYSRTKKEFFEEEYKGLVATLGTKIDNFKKQGTATDISVYFRDLNSGHWTGINENDKFDPASLLKVVLLVTYLKESLTHPEILAKELYYPGADETGQYYKESEKLTIGNHTVLDLIKAMIVQSDNTAKKILTDNATKQFDETYKDFRLPLPSTPSSDDYMSARSYSVIFRSLYNSTYLPWNFSEQTLSLLSVTAFDKGIVAGVPEGTKVSHKFGERTYEEANGGVEKRELHDCGIVYYPNHPYLVCVMTRGKEFSGLEKVISDISSTIYSYVKSTEK
jgi:beta-lactamase class A